MLIALPLPSLVQSKLPPRLLLTHTTKEFVKCLGITPDSQVFCRESEDGYSLITDEFDSYETARKYCDLVAEALKEKSVNATGDERQAILDNWYDNNVKGNVDNTTAVSSPDGDRLGDAIYHVLSEYISNLGCLRMAVDNGNRCSNRVRDYFGVPDRMSDAAALECLDTVYSNSQADARHALSNWAYTLVGDEPLTNGEKERLTKQLEEASKEAGLQKTDNAYLNKRIDELVKEREDGRSHILELEGRNKDLHLVNEEQLARIGELQAIASESAGERHLLRENCDRLREMNQDLINKNAVLTDESNKEAGLQKIKSDAINNLVEDLRGERKSLYGTLEKTRETLAKSHKELTSATQENNLLKKSVDELSREVATLRQHKSVLLLQCQNHEKTIDFLKKEAVISSVNRFLEWHPERQDLIKARLFLKRFSPGNTGAYAEEYLRAWQCVLAEKRGLVDYDPLPNKKPPTFTHIGIDPSSGGDRTVHQAIINDNGKLRSVELPYVSIKAHDDAGVDSAMWLQEFLNNTETGRHIVANAIEESEKCVGIVLDKMASGENPQEKVAVSNS